MSRCTLYLTRAVLMLSTSLGLAIRAPDARAESPHLLIRPADVPRLRHAIGLRQAADSSRGWGRFGARAGDYQALRAHFLKHVEGAALPGELLAAAFLHVVDPDDPSDRVRIELINATLRQPLPATADAFETLLAADWCWEALDADARDRFLLRMRQRAEPLTPADSPLRPHRFRRRLAALALALTVDETRDSGPSWLTLRARLLESGRTYFETTFPTYVAWRGLSPTGPDVAAREECDTALAIELGECVLGRALWPDYRDSVGRWMEHYVFATLDHPALQHHFIRDDGRRAPLTPAPRWSDMLPITAHLIAARTHDPAAAQMAGRVETALRGSGAALLPTLWRWVPIVFDTHDVAACNPQRLPAARNFRGAVVLRGGRGPQATAIWIEAGQPFLRRRQHFDAGHFIIHHGGHLTTGGGDDVVHEAQPSKGGLQRLGAQRGPFDFEQYCTATIAHNALVCWDAARLQRWYGVLYRPTGGQRCIEHTCTDFANSLEVQARQTGRQLAYGLHRDAAYLALDLAPAYEARAVAEYTREFVFFWGRALVVIDRVSLPTSRATPTWILNLPARPQVDSHDLTDAARVAGSTNDAGIWQPDGARWIHWTERDGSLWMKALLPEARLLRVVGGPAQKQLVKAGAHAGRAYIGGDPDGYERPIIPAHRHAAANAWYRLGEPTLLGPEVGRVAQWGRIELEPAVRSKTHTFLTVLIPAPADSDVVPTAEVERGDAHLQLHVTAGEQAATLRIPVAGVPGGVLEVKGAESFVWQLPAAVQPDEPLRVR